MGVATIAVVSVVAAVIAVVVLDGGNRTAQVVTRLPESHLSGPSVLFAQAIRKGWIKPADFGCVSATVCTPEVPRLPWCTGGNTGYPTAKAAVAAADAVADSPSCVSDPRKSLYGSPVP